MDCQNHEASPEGAGPYAHERQALIPISTLESWTVCEGEPDVRGWEVRSLAGRPLGAVGDLLIDGTAGEVVFLDIDLTANDRRTFVPARMVRFDRARRLVLMDSADLPESDIPKGRFSAAAGRRSVNRAIHYPNRGLAERGDHPAAENREVVDRRKIERVSSDF